MFENDSALGSASDRAFLFAGTPVLGQKLSVRIAQ
jgi:hypothetical protein